MASKGTGYFDCKGTYFRTADEATLSDLAALLGKVGDGDSLAPGIAKILLQRRHDIERIFRDHDKMFQGEQESPVARVVHPFASDDEGNVTALRA